MVINIGDLKRLIRFILTALGDTHPTMPENAIKEKHANVTGEILGNPEKKKCRNLELSGSTNQNCATSNVDSSSRRKGMVLPFAQLSLSFNAVKYSVDMPQVYFFIKIINTWIINISF